METETPARGFMLNDALYGKMKFVVQIFLPAFSTLYFTLGTIWGLPAVEQVIGTLAALATFLGVLLGLSSRTYNESDAKFDGVIDIETNEDGGKVYSLVLNTDPTNLDQKESALFKIGG
jgi:hypothetical protein